MQEGTWVAILMGKSMFGADTVTFQQKGSETIVTDQYSTGYWMPSTDAQQDYKDIKSVKVGKDRWNIVAFREMDTGDYKYDTMVKCGSKNEWMWAGSNLTSYVLMHNKKGTINFTLPKDCGNPNVVQKVGANSLMMMSSVLMLALVSIIV